jgi:hypothetical protein
METMVHKEVRVRFLKFFFMMIIFSLAFISCGKNNQKIVTDIDVQERIDQDKVFIDVEAKLDLGNTVLLAGKFPIKLPKHGLIGEVELGMDFVKVSVLLSTLVKLQIENAELPNGLALPLIKNNKVVVIPLDKKSKSFLYFSLIGGAKAVGVTLAIKELDKLGAELKNPSYPSANIQLGEFVVNAGIYTSPVEGENGLAIFTDLNPIFKVLAAQGAWFEIHDGSDQFKLDYEPVKVSTSTKKKVDNYVYKLHRRSAVLSALR